jgi:hypothetical protein
MFTSMGERANWWGIERHRGIVSLAARPCDPQTNEQIGAATLVQPTCKAAVTRI